jgi:hypothetical protein
MKGIIHLLGAGTIALGTVHVAKTHSSGEHHSRGLTRRMATAQTHNVIRHPRIHSHKF